MMIAIGNHIGQAHPSPGSVAQVLQGAGAPLAFWDMFSGTTRGTTPAASGSSPPAVTWTLSGNAATRNVVARLECTTGGDETAARFRYGTVNAAGTFTPIESNKARSGGVITFAGALEGFTANIPAATYANNNVWRDVAASVADSGSGGNAMTPPSAARAPLLVMAPGERLAVSNDPGGTRMLSSALNLPAPGTTPFWIMAVLRVTNSATTGMYVGDGVTSSAVLYTAGGNIHVYNGADKTVAAVSANTWVLATYYMSNAAGDAQRHGTARTTGATGNQNPSAAFSLFGSTSGDFSALPGFADIAQVGAWLGLPTNIDSGAAFLTTQYPDLVV